MGFVSGAGVGRVRGGDRRRAHGAYSIGPRAVCMRRTEGAATTDLALARRCISDGCKAAEVTEVARRLDALRKTHVERIADIDSCIEEMEHFGLLE